jgi:hypothetical protein
LAEGEGFEPPVPCGTPVFKTGSLNHSDTPPKEMNYFVVGTTGAGVAGIAGVAEPPEKGNAGCCAAAGAVLTFSMTESVPLEVRRERMIVFNKNAVPRIIVILTRMLPVCAPNKASAVPPPKLRPKPPSFGFCNRTTAPNNTQIIISITYKKVTNACIIVSVSLLT